MGGSDKRLVRRAARGDRGAFEEIYRRYGSDLYRFCLAMTGNRQDAQDALQNTMVKVLRALPGEKRQIALKPWLYRIARNETVEVLRKRRDGDELRLERTATSTIVEAAETREHLRTLLGDLEQLPQRQRAVLLMRELAGLGFAEIGAAFGTSAAAARQALYEARLSLRQLEEGRERRCGDVRRELSNADGRVTRRRKTRAHLRSCPDCRAFYAEIVKRQEDLAAIGALPLAVAADLLRGVAGHAGGGAAGGGGIGAAVGVAASKGIAAPTIVKSAAAIAAAVVAVSAVDRGSLIEVSHNGGREVIAQRTSPAPQAPAPPTGPSVESSSFAEAGPRDEQVAGARIEAVQNQADHRTQPSPPVPAQPAVPSPSQGYGETPVSTGADTTKETDVGDSPSSPSDLTAAGRKSARAASSPGHSPPTEKPGRRSSSNRPARGRPGTSPGNGTEPPDLADTTSDEPEVSPDPHEEPPGKSGEAPGHSGEAGHGHSISDSGH